jgi:hypothetical protein
MRLSLLAVGSLCMALGLGFAPGCDDSDDNNTDAGTGGRGGTGGSTGGTGGSTGGTGGSTGGTGGSTGGTGGSAAVSFADVQAIFVKSSNTCPLCHTGTGTVLPGAMDIKSHSALLADSVECTGAMARKRVKPGDAANSYLVHKIKGIMLCPKADGTPSAKMPATGGAGVSAEDIAKIEAWINAGAPM